MNEKQIRNSIVGFYKENPLTELTAAEVAKKFNFQQETVTKTNHTVRDLKRTALGTRSVVKNHDFLLDSLTNSYKDLQEEITKYKEDFEKGTIESTIVVTFDPKSIEELYAEHKIDSNKYSIKNYWSKKLPSGRFTSSVFAVRKTLESANEADFLSLLERYRPNYIPLSKKDILLNNSFGRPNSLILNITDFHLDKLDLEGTTLEAKKELFFSIIKRLLYKAYQSNLLDEIVFILGSDMLHTDTYTNTTTKGTQLEVNAPWDKAFIEAFDIYSTVINSLKQFCNKLNIILVQGNHDRTKSFYLAFGLQKFFEKESSISFDVNSCPRKVYTYGNTFIGFHHGDCKIMELPLLFAKEFPELWGKCKFHEIITGDKHFLQTKEIQGVRVRQLPSTSKADSWHNQSNFINSIPAAIATVYDKEYGACMTIEERASV